VISNSSTRSSGCRLDAYLPHMPARLVRRTDGPRCHVREPNGESGMTPPGAVAVHLIG